MTKPDPTPQRPRERVGECVVSVSEEDSRAHASRVCRSVPLPTGTDTLSEPAPVCRLTVSTPWFQSDQIQWTYTTWTTPRRSHPRTVNCPTCGAPPAAHCVTRRGTQAAHHKQRARLAKGTCCFGYGTPGTCPNGRTR